MELSHIRSLVFTQSCCWSATVESLSYDPSIPNGTFAFLHLRKSTSRSFPAVLPSWQRPQELPFGAEAQLWQCQNLPAYKSLPWLLMRIPDDLRVPTKSKCRISPYFPSLHLSLTWVWRRVVHNMSRPSCDEDKRAIYRDRLLRDEILQKLRP